MGCRRMLNMSAVTEGYSVRVNIREYGVTWKTGAMLVVVCSCFWTGEELDYVVLITPSRRVQQQQ